MSPQILTPLPGIVWVKIKVDLAETRMDTGSCRLCGVRSFGSNGLRLHVDVNAGWPTICVCGIRLPPQILTPRVFLGFSLTNQALDAAVLTEYS